MLTIVAFRLGASNAESFPEGVTLAATNARISESRITRDRDVLVASCVSWFKMSCRAIAVRHAFALALRASAWRLFASAFHVLQASHLHP